MPIDVKKEYMEKPPLMPTRPIPTLDEFTEKFTLVVHVPDEPVPQVPELNICGDHSY
jgi:hypothetical protein